jgi:heat shock protein HslJ
VLTAYDDGSGPLVDALSDVVVTSLFTVDERISGSAGCNEYVSIYTLDGETLTISVPAMTRNECADPPGIMLQETGFLSNLTRASSYEIDGDELHLLDQAGNALLLFSSSSG